MITIGNCKDCKHWHRAYEAEGMIRKPYVGTGEMIKGNITVNSPNEYDESKFLKIEGSEKSYGSCSKLFEEEENPNDGVEMLLAYARDVEAILTNENFGCVKFEQK